MPSPTRRNAMLRPCAPLIGLAHALIGIACAAETRARFATPQVIHRRAGGKEMPCADSALGTPLCRRKVLNVERGRGPGRHVSPYSCAGRVRPTGGNLARREDRINQLNGCHAPVHHHSPSSVHGGGRAVCSMRTRERQADAINARLPPWLCEPGRQGRHFEQPESCHRAAPCSQGRA